MSKLILPGDKGFRKIEYPWHRLRKLYGLPQKIDSDSQIEIHGFFVKDNRSSPPIAIFKNCKFSLAAGTTPKIDETPVPFSSLGEAYGHLKELTKNLSMSEQKKFKLAALSPDPGVFHPRPDILFPTPDEFKN